MSEPLYIKKHTKEEEHHHFGKSSTFEEDEWGRGHVGKAASNGSNIRARRLIMERITREKNAIYKLPVGCFRANSNGICEEVSLAPAGLGHGIKEAKRPTVDRGQHVLVGSTGQQHTLARQASRVVQ